jgi:hypothetical protein
MNKLLSILVVLGVAGCARHDAQPAFRSSLRISDRGISIPLPPPSLLEEPNQAVDIEGEVVGDDPLGEGTAAHVIELEGSQELSVELDEGAEAFVMRGLPVDLLDNCIELWLEQADGAQSEHAFYTASVAADGVTVLVTPDCE